MIKFVVHGPFDVPLRNVASRNREGKEIDPNALSAFWDEVQLGDKRGCYIFSNCVARGSKPIYVGKTKNTFKGECFQSHKINKLGHFFDNAGHVKLQLYLIVLEGRGQNLVELNEAENYLIIMAKNVNAQLLNDRKVAHKWAIKDIYGERSIGQPTANVQLLKKCLKIK